jgi:hypothetical protein
MTWASLEMPLSSALILLVISSATITSAKEEGLRKFKKTNKSAIPLPNLR